MLQKLKMSGRAGPLGLYADFFFFYLIIDGDDEAAWPSGLGVKRRMQGLRV